MHYTVRMDIETDALIATATRQACWAAEAVVRTDALIEVVRRRPLDPEEQRESLVLQRELLVRFSQQHTLLAWALESRTGGWSAWLRLLLAWCRTR